MKGQINPYGHSFDKRLIIRYNQMYNSYKIHLLIKLMLKNVL